MKKEEREQRAKEKLLEMSRWEQALHERSIHLIAGIDEAGRGPLAGPVVAAAVILPRDFAIVGIDDSKKLSEKKREHFFKVIQEEALAFGVGIVDHETIDRINILQATKLAMSQAIEALSPGPEYLLLDAVALPDVAVAQESIIKGDAKSISIAAASILAKVTRDHLMQEFAKEFPFYGFEQNKGYGTKAHYAGIAEHGICRIHRRSFLKSVL